MRPSITPARSLGMFFAALALSFPATASTSLNCSGQTAGKTAVEVHAILDCALDDGSYAWCDIAVKLNDQWLDLPRTLTSEIPPRVFPESPDDDFIGTRPLKPPVTVLRVLDESKKVILELTLDKIVASDTAVVFMGRATVSWKGRHIKDAAVACDDPG